MSQVVRQLQAIDNQLIRCCKFVFLFSNTKYKTMLQNSILLQNLDVEQLTALMENVFDTKFKDFKKELNTKTEDDDLMTRQEVLELLQINASTLWHYQNKGRITVYKFSNKCFYKKSEIMQSLIALKK